MKIKLNGMMEEIGNFERKAGFDKTSEKQLIIWLKDEINNYQNAKTAVIKRNKLMDIMILTIQVAIRRGYSLDDAWKRWWLKSQKYIRSKK